MTVFDKIDTKYKPWTLYHNKKDMLHATHSIIDATGSFELYCIAIEIPYDEKVTQLVEWMNKEVDTRTRFSLTDGQIQVEIEVWDGDYEKKLYFAGDLTLNQCIKVLEGKNFNMGFCPVGNPNVTLAGVQMLNRDDLVELLKLKQAIDVHPNRPGYWKVG